MRKRRKKKSTVQKRLTLGDFMTPAEIDEFVYNIPPGHYATISPDGKRIIIRKGVVIWKLRSRYPSTAQVVKCLDYPQDH